MIKKNDIYHSHVKIEPKFSITKKIQENRFFNTLNYNNTNLFFLFLFNEIVAPNLIYPKETKQWCNR